MTFINLKVKTIITFLLFCAIIFCISSNISVINRVDRLEQKLNERIEDIENKNIPSLRMYYAIKEYAHKYDIPEKYAFGLAYKETSYSGPFHYSYNPKQISYANAYGPMQILLPTAKYVWKDTIHEKEITPQKLLDNIEFNVETSMKYIRYLYDRFNDWHKVFVYYNCGSNTNQHSINYSYSICNFDYNKVWKSIK